MAQFKMPKKKELTPEQEAKLEEFGNQATTSPGTVNKTSLKPEPKQNQPETRKAAVAPAEEAETSKARKTKAKPTTGKSDKPNRSFTVPLNDYELDLLRQLADQEDRSQRWIARKTLVGALETALKKK